eukprot:CAMPEP_0172907916 /NCGR_PEP_ID=MMETSP1075-20121228/179757_1 /TAXON_ID=2916 /ORGANISM="Ceratium fusus, Strain PA161109" /LENGTH=43 /DNA_ID= /DNA_START= /DNA_END= /DNA_ORIENTATION=
MAFLQVRIMFFEPTEGGGNARGGTAAGGGSRSPEKILCMALFV